MQQVVEIHRFYFCLAEDLEQLAEELQLVRKIVLQAEEVSDIQLFTQLRHLGDIRKALLLEDSDMGRRLLTEAENLLSQVFDR